MGLTQNRKDQKKKKKKEISSGQENPDRCISSYYFTAMQRSTDLYSKNTEKHGRFHK